VTKELRRLFPKLIEGEYQVTGDRTREYNCIAWAAGVTDAWWGASEDGVWPEGIPTDGTITSVIRLYEALGYKTCADASLESGYEKIAIYGDVMGYTHAARQLPSGRWTSKLGGLEDIEHASPDTLVGDEYGYVVQIRRRALPPAQQPQEQSDPSAGNPSP
jgi:hypothetical protein